MGWSVQPLWEQLQSDKHNKTSKHTNNIKQTQLNKHKLVGWSVQPLREQLQSDIDRQTQANTETHNVDRQNKRQNTNTDRKTNIYKCNGIIYTIAIALLGYLGLPKENNLQKRKKRGTGPFALLVSLASKLHPSQPRPLQPLSTLYHRTLAGINGPWERLFLELYLRVKKHKKYKHTQMQKKERTKNSPSTSYRWLLTGPRVPSHPHKRLFLELWGENAKDLTEGYWVPPLPIG